MAAQVGSRIAPCCTIRWVAACRCPDRELPAHKRNLAGNTWASSCPTGWVLCRQACQLLTGPNQIQVQQLLTFPSLAPGSSSALLLGMLLRMWLALFRMLALMPRFGLEAVGSASPVRSVLIFSALYQAGPQHKQQPAAEKVPGEPQQCAKLSTCMLQRPQVRNHSQVGVSHVACPASVLHLDLPCPSSSPGLPSGLVALLLSAGCTSFVARSTREV